MFCGSMADEWHDCGCHCCIWNWCDDVIKATDTGCGCCSVWKMGWEYEIVDTNDDEDNKKRPLIKKISSLYHSHLVI